jgi:hypothetical protein
MVGVTRMSGLPHASWVLMEGSQSKALSRCVQGEGQARVRSGTSHSSPYAPRRRPNWYEEPLQIRSHLLGWPRRIGGDRHTIDHRVHRVRLGLKGRSSDNAEVVAS